MIFSQLKDNRISRECVLSHTTYAPHRLAISGVAKPVRFIVWLGSGPALTPIHQLPPVNLLPAAVSVYVPLPAFEISPLSRGLRIELRAHEFALVASSLGKAFAAKSSRWTATDASASDRSMAFSLWLRSSVACKAVADGAAADFPSVRAAARVLPWPRLRVGCRTPVPDASPGDD